MIRLRSLALAFAGALLCVSVASSQIGEIDSGHVLANSSAAAREARGTSGTEWLDRWCSSTNNTVVVRQAGSWVCSVTLAGLTLTAPDINGGTADALTSLGIRSTGAAFDLRFATSEVLTANRTLNYVLGNANRTITLGSDIFTSGAVTINGSFATFGGFGVNLTATALTNATLPAGTRTLASLDGTETLTNKSIVATQLTGTLAAAQFPVLTGDVTTTAGALATTIANNAVTNAKSAQMAAVTLKGNPTAALANATDFTLAGLVSRGAPDAANDLLLIWDAAAGTFKKVTPAAVASAGASGVSSFNGLTGAVVAWSVPQGRLTLTSGVPVPTASVTAATTVYYTGYQGGKFVPIYNGSQVAEYPICAANTVGPCEVSVALGSNWATNSNYDHFIGLDGATVRLCTGPAWGSDTVPPTGAGTSEVEQLDGIDTNKVSMTCRYNNTTTFTCAAHQCTYVGTMRTGAAGQTNFIFGVSGTAGLLGLWNRYNRVDVSSATSINASSWSYTSATKRESNGSTTARTNFIIGRASDSVTASHNQTIQSPATTGAQGNIGVALNSTTVSDSSASLATPAAGILLNGLVAKNAYNGVQGFNFIAPIEWGDGTNTFVFYGGAVALHKMIVGLRM